MCKSHTTGRQCDRCETGYYNLTSSHPAGCQRCVCDAVGTVNASTTCDAVTGQCPCKSNVAGIQCDQCAIGYFNLTEDNPDGCDSCSCSEPGTSATDRSCDLHTGQCRCKKHVTGNCGRLLYRFGSRRAIDIGPYDVIYDVTCWRVPTKFRKVASAIVHLMNINSV